MAYRDDVEALEARLRGLDAELAVQTRARDEAAQLLAEARRHASDQRARYGTTVRDAARWRRGVWRFAFSLVAAAAVLAGIVQVGNYVERRRIAAQLDRYESSVEALCRCVDDACVTRRLYEALEIESRTQRALVFVPEDEGSGRRRELAEMRIACTSRIWSQLPSQEVN